MTTGNVTAMDAGTVDKDQIPHLLALIDDESVVVKTSVISAFLSFGPDLDPLLAEAGASPGQADAVRKLLRGSPGAPQFRVGELVRHKRHGYRGVVVSIDVECDADDAWYQANDTQPDRDQPWYHVLADGSDKIFYPAESSLEADSSVDKVNNPHVSEFFGEFLDGVYVRNGKPWDKGE